MPEGTPGFGTSIALHIPERNLTEKITMFAREPASMIETYFPETYASSTRSDDAIRKSLSAVMDDFSLSDEVIVDADDQCWPN
jgi:hypothetical protein